MKNNYIRVGTTYFKKSLYPTLSGDRIEILLPWSPELIRQDHGKNALSEMETFDGFICFPENRLEFYLKNHASITRLIFAPPRALIRIRSQPLPIADKLAKLKNCLKAKAGI